MDKRPLKKALIFIIFGSLAFLLYLYFVVGFNDLINAFAEVNPYSYMLYYVAAFAVMVLSMLFYSVSWERLMRAISLRVGLRRAFVYCWLGNFVDLIMPLETVSGEITKVYLVQRKTGDQPGKIAASIVAHRIIITLMTSCGLFAASILFIMEYSVSAIILYLLLAAMLGSLLLIILLIALSLRRDLTEKIIDFSLKLAAPLLGRSLNLPGLRDKIQHNLLEYHSEFKAFGKNRRALLEATIYGLLAWLLYLSVYLLVFCALGFSEITTKFYGVIVVCSLSASLQSIPIALPLGLVEMTMTSIYTLFGIPASISGIATLLTRIATFWFPITSGYIIAQWIGVKNLIEQGLKSTST